MEISYTNDDGKKMDEYSGDEAISFFDDTKREKKNDKSRKVTWWTIFFFFFFLFFFLSCESHCSASFFNGTPTRWWGANPSLAKDFLLFITIVFFFSLERCNLFFFLWMFCFCFPCWSEHHSTLLFCEHLILFPCSSVFFFQKCFSFFFFFFFSFVYFLSVPPKGLRRSG